MYYGKFSVKLTFPHTENDDMRKMTEAKFEELLQSGEITLPPLEIEVVSLNAPGGEDAIVDARWKSKTCRYVVEYKSDSKPKTLRAAMDQAKRFANRSDNVQPMIMVPYLSDKKLEELSCEGVSGIDLCGNGIVEAPGLFSVTRTGKPNRYPDSEPLRTAYRGETSVVARALLLRDTFDSVGEVLDFIETRSGTVAMSTVSKALKRLEQDLVIERASTPAVRVIDRQKLVEQLTSNYRPAKQLKTWTGKVDLSKEELRMRIAEIARQLPVVQTGMGSAERYVVFKGESVFEAYTKTPIANILAKLGSDAKETSAFPNLRLIQTDDQRVFFDKRDNIAASPIQVWLEMADGDKRSREAGEPLRQRMIMGQAVIDVG